MLTRAATLFIPWTMIVFTDFWTEYVLAFGFMESLAKDFKQPQSSASALILLGWIGLLLICYFIFF